MKLTQIFGIVVLIHVGVICLLLVQPGCQSTQADPQPSATLSQTAAPSAPTTPASPQPSTSGQLDPAFNANLTPAPAGRTEPQRPTAPTRPAASSPTPAATQDNQPVLQPLRPVTNGQASTQSYTVQAGDNLTVIARRHNITVAELRAANNLSQRSYQCWPAVEYSGN
ncbi:MAG: LysM peptidoglycan-binding domain-containing protein [Verrucomicrobia bacterium]|nr:LysM peptidoglycan-binding domain-containing protein [Verrucomicrobiota bacterium]